MVVLTVIFALLNICLGFALAAYLGHGPAGLSFANKGLSDNDVQTTHESDIVGSSEFPSETGEVVNDEDGITKE